MNNPGSTDSPWSFAAAFIRSRKLVHVRPDDDDDRIIQKYQKRMKDVLANAISSVYWDCLLDHVRASHVGARTPLREVASRLDVADSTVSRWYAGEVFPDANKFFVAALAMDIQLLSLDYPDRRDVIVQAEIHALHHIRVKHLKCQPAPLTPDKLYFLERCYALPDSWRFVVPLTRGRTAPLHDTIIKRLLREVGERFVDTNLKTEADLLNVMRSWLPCYTAYRIGRPQKWTFLDENEI